MTKEELIYQLQLANDQLAYYSDPAIMKQLQDAVTSICSNTSLPVTDCNQAKLKLSVGENALKTLPAKIKDLKDQLGLTPVSNKVTTNYTPYIIAALIVGTIVFLIYYNKR